MKSQTVAHVKRLTQTCREFLRIQQEIGQTCSGFLVQTMVEPHAAAHIGCVVSAPVTCIGDMHWLP